MKLKLKSVLPIWGEAPHNAFTSIVHFSGAFYCAFREGGDHDAEDGKIRVIASPDGVRWKAVALFAATDEVLADLRDPKLAILPDGRLAVLAGATSRTEYAPRRNYLWYSLDGHAWSAAESLEGDGEWFWSFCVDGDTTYFSSYASLRGKEGVALYSSRNLPVIEKLLDLHNDACSPNETAIAFKGGSGIAVIRREMAQGQTSVPPYNNGTALLATSISPYKDWEISDLGVYVGGPALLEVGDGNWLLGGRKNIGGVHETALWLLDPKRRSLTELLLLPSAGDCSYPGLLWHGEELFVSYYSSHEGRTQIYLARLEVVKSEALRVPALAGEFISF